MADNCASNRSTCSSSDNPVFAKEDHFSPPSFGAYLELESESAIKSALPTITTILGSKALRLKEQLLLQLMVEGNDLLYPSMERKEDPKHPLDCWNTKKS